MIFHQRVTIIPATGNEYIPITEWAQNALNDQEKDEFDRLYAEQEKVLHNVRLNGYTTAESVTVQVKEYMWDLHPEVPGVRQTNSQWVSLRERWLTETNQTRIDKIITIEN